MRPSSSLPPAREVRSLRTCASGGLGFPDQPYEWLVIIFSGFTVGRPACSRSQHDLNFTVGYDGRHASYSISSDFRGYKELDNFDDDDGEEADAADAGTAADDGADYDE